MKIITFTDIVLPNTNANVLQRFQMTEEFTKKNIESYIYVRKKNIQSVKSFNQQIGIKNEVKIKSSNFNNTYLHRFKFLKSILFEKNSVIYTRDILVATLINIIFKKKAALELHTGNFSSYQFFLLRILKFFSNEKLLIIFISNELKKTFIDEFSDNWKCKLIVLHDGISDHKIPSKLNLDRSKDICYIGSFYKGRGIDLIEKIAKELPHINFDLYGEEHPRTYKEKNIKSLGRVDNSKIINILSEYKICLMPYQENTSTSGGDITSKWMSPLKMFEYMASGAVIISSNLKVLTEVLNDKNSILVNPENHIEWGSKIEKTINDKETLKKISLNAHNDALNYTLSKRANSIINEFN